MQPNALSDWIVKTPPETGEFSVLWFIIAIGWLISIFLGFVNVHIAYAAWILWPNLVAVWGNHKRRILRETYTSESDQHGRKKDRK